MPVRYYVIGDCRYELGALVLKGAQCRNGILWVKMGCSDIMGKMLYRYGRCVSSKNGVLVWYGVLWI